MTSKTRGNTLAVRSTAYAPVVLTAVTTAILLLVALAPMDGQAPALARAGGEPNEARTKRIAQQFEARAQVLTVFDRQGKVLTTVGERGIYEAPIFSPDRSRLAVIKIDLESETRDLWVLDATTGATTRITSNQIFEVEQVRWPMWSPDGKQLAYFALRGGYWGLYRKASNGQGPEELLYQSPGARLGLTDWSADGRFLYFHATDLSGGTLYELPLAGSGARQPVEVLRNEFQLRGSRLSPDGRWLAYQSDQSGRDEIYVRSFGTTAGTSSVSAMAPQRVSDGIQASPAFWRDRGDELYYVSADRSVMAVTVKTTPTLTLAKPRLLFRLSEAVAVNDSTVSISRDGERVVVAVPHAPTLRQITVIDRQGNVITKVGEPGLHVNPSLSPDGKKVAVMRTDPQEGDVDIWAYDVASGKGVAVTTDTWPEYGPIWSPDGRQVAYGSTRGNFTSIYRKNSDGTGNEEKLFQYTPGADLVVTDWSADGRFLTFHDGCSGVLHVVPVTPARSTLVPTAMEWLRDEYSVAQARLSHDLRYMAYLSDELSSREQFEAEIGDVYVRPFDPAKSDVSSGGAKPIRVSTTGARGMIVWRQDGKELYYLTDDWEVMAMEEQTTSAFTGG